MIVYCCSDLIFATRIRATAEPLGVVTRPVRNPQMLADRLAQVDDGKANEPVSALMVDLDTGEQGLELIRQFKASAPALPVVAFGAHVAVEMLAAAREAGAEQVMPRGQFVTVLPQLLQQYAR